MTSVIENIEDTFINMYQSNLTTIVKLLRDQQKILEFLPNKEDFDSSEESSRMRKIMDLVPITNRSKKNIFTTFKLTKIERKILNFYFRKLNVGGISSIDLVREGIIENRSMAWNYLKRLEEKGVLELAEQGKPSKYKLRKDLKHPF